MATLDESCATCARYLNTITPQYDEKSEKPKTQDRTLDCCGRVICGNCILSNSRFATYCPFCQISTTPTPLPQGLKDPPSYTPATSTSKDTNASLPINPPAYSDELPTYSSLNTTPQFITTSEKQNPNTNANTQPAEDVLHFLNHDTDTLPSLSLRYNVPIPALRKTNNLTADHLLRARRTLLIPGEFYKGGVSLSPQPIEGEEEERRKGTVRKWMVRCKVSEYDVAVLYLENAGYDFDMAVSVFEDDERWEGENPLKGKGKQKGWDVGRRRFTGLR
ncbi:hypothetical protein LHYA1_G001378 [Lachnellula hyalina]|uniref:LysM domain-containing protein n=1 Tax=Lachnellula hyalina TaxID=1316788 RepID=A0A8H8R7Z6_9HELO|nr:uncharacterized protein LHYA1_G001378 [Lachnellula hyalina]TVY29287.1 hypothetical protein LHYA1_G001378 [Lachnellula hyalina]